MRDTAYWTMVYWLLLSDLPNETTAQETNQTVAELIARNPRTSLFRGFAEFTGLSQLFADTSSNLTVFIPLDDGFGNILDHYLAPQWVLHVRDVQETHVVTTGAMRISDLSNSLVAMNNNSLQVTMNSNENSVIGEVSSSLSQLVNGKATIVESDVMASNGVIHYIDRVLPPSWYVYDLVQLALLNQEFLGQFSISIDLIFRSGMSVSGPEFTIFAPKNSVLSELGEMLDFYRDPANKEALGVFLLGHIADKAYPLVNAKDGDIIATLSGSSIHVSVVNETTVLFNGANVGELNNVLANNGIMHSINGVFLPETPAPSTAAPSESPSFTPSLAPSVAPTLSMMPSAAPSMAPSFPAEAFVTDTVKNLVLTLISKDRAFTVLNETETKAFQNVTIIWCQNFFATRKATYGVRELSTDVKVTGQAINGSSLMLSFDQMFRYVQFATPLLHNEQYATAPFLDEGENEFYRRQLSESIPALRNISDSLISPPRIVVDPALDGSSSENSLSTGAIIGIAVSCSLGVVFLVAAILFKFFQKSESSTIRAFAYPAENTHVGPPTAVIGEDAITPQIVEVLPTNRPSRRQRDSPKHALPEFKDQVRNATQISTPKTSTTASTSTSKESLSFKDQTRNVPHSRRQHNVPSPDIRLANSRPSSNYAERRHDETPASGEETPKNHTEYSPPWWWNYGHTPPHQEQTTRKRLSQQFLATMQTDDEFENGSGLGSDAGRCMDEAATETEMGRDNADDSRFEI